MIERIVAAAIRSGPCVFTGPHHATIIHYVAKCTGIKTVKGEQGFITSKGRFLSRKEAAVVAIASGQLAADHSKESMFSEELWIVPDYGWVPAPATPEPASDRDFWREPWMHTTCGTPHGPAEPCPLVPDTPRDEKEKA